ncbi:hypothetical protein ACJX0J_008458, partial [Zea mays]
MAMEIGHLQHIKISHNEISGMESTCLVSDKKVYLKWTHETVFYKRFMFFGGNSYLMLLTCVVRLLRVLVHIGPIATLKYLVLFYHFLALLWMSTMMGATI